MKLDISLRTCDTGAVHPYFKRYCGKPKNEIVQHCINSLIHSCNQVRNHDIRLTVFDDHSTEETTNHIKSRLATCNFPTRFIHLEQRGYNNSNYQQFLLCRDSDADLVYSVEDDYLHVPTAIQEMIDSYKIFKDRLNHEIVLHPFDPPLIYNPPQDKSYIAHGSHRHWRTATSTTATLLTTPHLFKTYWNLFESLALKYNNPNLNEPAVSEHNTICLIYQSGKAVLLNPIPSLALHMQNEEHIDPFIDWQYWWSEYGK